MSDFKPGEIMPIFRRFLCLNAEKSLSGTDFSMLTRKYGFPVF